MKKTDTVKRILIRIKKYRFYLIAAMVMSAVTVAGTLYIPILTGRCVDLILGKGRVDLAGLAYLLKLMAVCAVLTGLAQWVQNACSSHLAFQVVRDIRNDAYEKLHSLPVSYMDTHSRGDITSRIIADTDQFSDGLLMGFNQLFTGVLTIAGTLFFMFRENAGIALIVVLLTPLSMLMARFIAIRTYSLFSRQSKTRGEQTALIDEYVSNAGLVQALCLEEKIKGRFGEINKRLRKESLKAVFFSSITNPATRFINNLVYAAVAVFGSLLVIRGSGFTAGMLTAFLAYANQYTKPFNEISGVVTELQNALACADRVFELLDQEDEPEEKGALPREIRGNVGFEGVDFSYVPGKPLIENMNLSVRAGERVAIVGPTGAGKSTVINLLMRFYDPDRGRILLEGEDISGIGRQELRGCFGMVLQETWIKNGTIRENIAMGRLDADGEEIIKAAEAAHAHSFIRRLPLGYDTPVSDEAGHLSQGQKQLLCIARLMLSVPPMLILDEATSSIDTRTELKIQDAFARLMKGRTSFVVAHRLNTIKSADIILFMKDGHIVEQGSHEELMSRGGAYAALFNSQFA